MQESPNAPSSRRPRIYWILGIGLLLIAGTFAYVHYTFARPIGSGPAGPAVPAEPFDTVWTTRPVEVVGIGDSITAGLGADSPDHSYFNRLLFNPPDEFPDMQGKCLSRVLPELTSENLAVSGTTSLQHADTIRFRLTPRDEDVFGLILMTSGGNDIIHNYGRGEPKEGAMYGATLAQAEPWIEAFETRLNQMLDEVSDQFPGGCEIFLADIYDPTDGVGDAPSIMLKHWPDGLAIHARYNAAIERAISAREHVHWVPLHQTFLGHGSHCRQFWRSTYDAQDPYYWFYENVEDPNDRGYDAIRRVFLNTILQHSELVPNRESS